MKNSEPDAVLEISPLYAATAEQLRTRKVPLKSIPTSARTYFGEKGIE
jgi:hypothetical protein